MNRKRILSMLLAALLMLSTFPAALAADNESPDASGTSVDGGELTPSSTQPPAGTTPEDGTQTNPDDLDDTDDEQDDDKEDAESAKEPPVQTPVTEDEPEETPVRKKAASREADEYTRLTWDDVSYNLAPNVESSLWTNQEEDGDYLITRDDEFSGVSPNCNAITYWLLEDSEDVEATFTFTYPEELENGQTLAVSHYKFRPGDHDDDTIINFEPETLANNSFEITVTEADSPWVHAFCFGILEDGDFTQISYEYAFELRVQKHDYLTWNDNVDFEYTGELDYAVHSPSTEDLFIEGNSDGWYNIGTVSLKRSANAPDEPVSATFKITGPESLNNDPSAMALIKWGGDAIEEKVSGNVVSFEVDENDYVYLTIQFGTLEGSEFVPQTYEHPLRLEVVCLEGLEKLTWDNISWTVPEANQAEYTQRYPAKDDPLLATLDGGGYYNELSIPVINMNAGDQIPITITPPDGLADEENLIMQYCPYLAGTSNNEVFELSPANGAFTFNVDVIPYGQETQKYYAVWFAVKDYYVDEAGNIDTDRFEYRKVTGEYHFDIRVPIYTPLTWSNILEPTLPESATLGSDGISYYPTRENSLEIKETDTAHGDNGIIVPVVNAAGDKVTFTMTTPDGWTSGNIFVDHFTNLRGAQTSDTAIHEKPQIENNTFSIDVEISKEIPSRWHGIWFWLEDEDGNMIERTPVYTFDLIAKDVSGAVVTAPATAENGTAAATVTGIEGVLSENPDETTVFVDATADANGSIITGVDAATVTIDKDDAAAIVDTIGETPVSLEIATPVATVTLPAEAVQQATQDAAEDASMMLKVEKTADDGEVEVNNVTVTDAEIFAVTLHLVSEDGTETEVPISLAGGSIKVSVVTAQSGDLAVVYLPTNGQRPVLMTSKITKDANDRVSFTTPHLSDFAIVSWEQAQALTYQRTPYRGSSSGRGTTASTTPVTLKTGSNGSVTFSPSKPSEGDKVTVTVKPNSGYELDEIKATADGKNVRLSEQDENVFTFTMPEDPVTINTTFKRIEDTPEPTETVSKATFYDVASSDWYAGAVEFVSERGMMAGNSGRFTPNDNLTRSMMAQILYNLEGGSGSGSASFPDVQASDWFAGSVSWAASQRLMDGYGNGSFGPNDSITREQLASILYRYAGTKGYSVSASADLSSFTDGASVSSWAAESVRWAVGAGLLTGKSGSRLDPTGTATRAEVAQILMNFYTQVAA